MAGNANGHELRHRAKGVQKLKISLFQTELKERNICETQHLKGISFMNEYLWEDNGMMSYWPLSDIAEI
jgi:hypothetical protein